MIFSTRATLVAGLSIFLVARGAAAQDSTMKHATMKHDTAMPADSMMGHDKMMHDKMGNDAMMMAPHGMFAGAHDHKVSGGYAIATAEGHQTLQLSGDFALDGAPDPYVVLSADDMGSGTHTLNLGRLKQQRGKSTFAIPAGADLTQYHHVLIWCKKYNVTLGQAELAAGGAMMHN